MSQDLLVVFLGPNTLNMSEALYERNRQRRWSCATFQHLVPGKLYLPMPGQARAVGSDLIVVVWLPTSEPDEVAFATSVVDEILQRADEQCTVITNVPQRLLGERTGISAFGEQLTSPTAFTQAVDTAATMLVSRR